MTGFTSSWKSTRSPITMASAFLPFWEASQDVSPMKGRMTEPSTVTFTSVRGEVTLNTPSASFIAPLRPVTS
mgnify:CR=1 FL=1